MKSSEKIYFDARHISKGGIGIYIRSVLDRLIQSDLNICILTSNLNDIMKYLQYGNVTYLKAPKLFSIVEQLWFVSKFTTFYNQIYISPYLTFPLFVKVKLIFVIHDVIWLLYPKYATGKLGYLYFKLFTIMGLRRSIKVITISESTKNDINTFMHGFKDKIEVLYVGFEKIEFIDIKPFSINAKYFVYVGSWKPWKNVPILLKAYSEFLDKKSNDEEVKLVLCGDNQTNMSDDIEGIISKNQKLKYNVIISGKIDRIDLLRWIKGAVALIQPSIYEGFGMAVVEGLALDTPVICSDIPVFKEIVGENVRYFQSGNITDLADKMLECYSASTFNKAINTDRESLFEKYNWQTITDYIVKICKNN